MFARIYLGRSMVLLACLSCAGMAAWAQTPTDNPADQTLFEAKGLPLGGFRLFPTLDVGANYDDNVLRTDVGQINDWYFSIKPAFLLTSEWSRHMLRLRAVYDEYLYNRLPDESHGDLDVAADGRLDLWNGMNLSATSSYEILHEARTSADLPANAVKETRYSDFHAGLDIDHSLGALGIRGGATFDQYNYSPTLLSGGATLDNRDRNRDEYQVYAKADYEFSLGYAAFVRAAYNDRSYELAVDASGVNRNSTGVRIDGGLDLEITRLLEGSVYAGYLQQNYKLPLKNVSGADYGTSLTWYPTPLVTVKLEAQHRIAETTLSNTAAANEQDVKLTADYSFRHDITLDGGVGYVEDRFSGAGRTDQIVSLNVGVKYFMNEYIYWRAGYQYSTRSSTITIFGFHDSTAMINLGLQL
ncbi:MAG: outer membrane beta-barrel protein [Alphaproteobacteria bacterium]|nr:outer membrane beta-barrel protein [Alphaproteobacteria bacterium]